MTEHPPHDAVRTWLRVRVALLILLSLMLAGVALLSFQWNFGYDTAQMLFYGRLIGQLHYVPYRDIFEENLPGAILAYTAIGALIDWSNRFLLRFFDLVYLTAIALATWRWLKPLGRQVGWAAAVLFGVFYLLGGPGFSTQREYVFLLPVVAGLAVATSAARMPDVRRGLIVGLLFGIATTIKPHAAIGLLPILVYWYFEVRARQGGLKPSAGQIIRTLAATAAGGIIPISALVIYLAAAGGLWPWLDIVTGYWPLYATTTGSITVLTGAERLQFIVGALVGLGGQAPWMIPAAVGAGFALWPGALTARQRRLVWLMIALAVGYMLYPALTGQFYPQHWLPMTYFILALSALCFVRPAAAARSPVAAAPLIAVLAALILRGDVLAGGVSQMVDVFVYHKPVPSIDGDRGAEIADFLRNHLAQGDTVQSLDPVGYAMHGMLLARATPATRFMADAPFYTQPDMPYIKGLRAELIDSLGRGAPRYVIDVVARARLHTDSGVPAFTELDNLLHDSYSPVYVGHGFLIYGRSNVPTPGLILYPFEASGMTTSDAAPFKNDLLVFAEGKPAANPYAVSQRLENLSQDHDVLLFENLGEDSESSRALELRLNQFAYRVSEQHLASTRLIEYLRPSPYCGSPGPADFRFGDVIHVGSAGVALREAFPDHFVCVQLAMDALHAPTRAYMLSVHVVDGAGRSVAQYDGQPVGNLVPTTAWTPGQTVDDQFALRLPDGLPSGDYTVRLYMSDVETSQALPAGGSVTFALLGTIHLPQ